jgi:stearoyl-CoA desaturase (delta-9 desaturase)
MFEFQFGLNGLVDGLLDWGANGALGLSAWQVLGVALVLTHITIASVTIFLHRAQAHRSLDLHPAVSHFFRFWLWLTTGMVTREWVAIHRKHHAKCETTEDPHSPMTRGLDTVVLRGVELYRAESKVVETIEKYGRGTPDDWMERNFYAGRAMLGISLMMVIDLALFGVLGLTVWAVQMVWIPFWAAGIVNGVAHYWGYRNFEAPDASTNISPWGVVIGGEELHNNHHTYPTSAKFSIRPYEFDIGWAYIRVLAFFRLAQVRKVAPQMRLGPIQLPADSKTLEALIANRYEVMASYAKEMRRVCAAEIVRLQAQGSANATAWRNLRLAQRWLHRDLQRLPQDVQLRLETAVNGAPELKLLFSMREELRMLWTRTNVSVDQLVVDLQDWCRRAESSGVAALSDFSMRLRAVQP